MTDAPPTTPREAILQTLHSIKPFFVFVVDSRKPEQTRNQVQRLKAFNRAITIYESTGDLTTMFTFLEGGDELDDSSKRGIVKMLRNKVEIMRLLENGE